MDKPYVLAKVNKATSTAGANVYAAATIVAPDRSSSRELVTAIDSQGINIYNIRSNQLATSYSLSPSTKFHCSPISYLDRLGSTRSTYAALQTGSEQLRVQCWGESSAASETSVTSFEVAEKVFGLHHLSDSILVIYQSGNLQRLSLDLSNSIDTIDASTYMKVDEDVLVNQSLQRTTNIGATHVLRLLTSGRVCVLHEMSFCSLDEALKQDTTLTQTTLPVLDELSTQASSRFAISDQGQVAICVAVAKDVEIVVFSGPEESQLKELRTVRSESLDGASISLRWLNSSQLAVSCQTQIDIWDVTYQTIQASIKLEEPAGLISIVPQKSSQTMVSSACMALSSSTSILLSQVSFASKSNLCNAIGNSQNPRRIHESWLLDVEMQATWKDSLQALSGPAMTCYKRLLTAKTGAEFDSIMEEFLFPVAQSSKPRSKTDRRKKNDSSHSTVSKRKKANIKNSRQQTIAHSTKGGVAPNLDLEHPKTNGFHKVSEDTTMTHGSISPAASEESEEEAELEAVLAKEITSRQFTAQERFDTYNSPLGLSATFAAKLVQLIFLESPSEMVPKATIDFLFKKRLLALPAETSLLSTIIKKRPDLRLRIIDEVPSLLPEQLLDILRTFLSDQDQLPYALTAIIKKLDLFDETIVTLAIRSKLQPSEITLIMETFSMEMSARISHPDAEAAMKVSDEALCAAITNFLDAAGVANMLLNRNLGDLVVSLRKAVGQLIARESELSSTVGSITELLMKALLLDTRKSKTEAVKEGHVESNPEPQPRKGPLALDQVKKQDKHQTKRAKAHARVQGIGSAYTIETLQI